jgi:hypothetical protein
MGAASGLTRSTQLPVPAFRVCQTLKSRYAGPRVRQDRGLTLTDKTRKVGWLGRGASASRGRVPRPSLRMVLGGQWRCREL